MFISGTALTSYSQSENGVRVFTGKCAISQTGGGSGYWQVTLTGFNVPGSTLDATEIDVDDFIYFSSGEVSYELQITLVVSAVTNTATVRVSSVGVVGISSVPTTNNAFVSRRTVNLGLTPAFVSNISDNENQIQSEYMVYKVDQAIGNLKDYSVFSSLDTAVFSRSGKTPLNGDFIAWKNRGQWLEKKNNGMTQVFSKNAENILDANKITVAYGALGVTNYNLNLGNFFYTSANGDITLMGSNELAQSTNNSASFLVFNNTEDYIDANFEPGLFVQFGTDPLDGAPVNMPAQRISPFGARLFEFTVVNLGEVAYLVSDNEAAGGALARYYTPTITKNLSTDTIVTVYTHMYIKSDNIVTVHGKVLVNNAAGTLASSFRVGFPPLITSNFTDVYNDVSGPVTCRQVGTFNGPYAGYPYADTTNDRVTISYTCDGNSSVRQVVEYSVSFKLLQ